MSRFINYPLCPVRPSRSDVHVRPHLNPVVNIVQMARRQGFVRSQIDWANMRAWFEWLESPLRQAPKDHLATRPAR